MTVFQDGKHGPGASRCPRCFLAIGLRVDITHLSCLPRAPKSVWHGACSSSNSHPTCAPSTAPRKVRCFSIYTTQRKPLIWSTAEACATQAASSRQRSWSGRSEQQHDRIKNSSRSLWGTKKFTGYRQFTGCQECTGFRAHQFMSCHVVAPARLPRSTDNGCLGFLLPFNGSPPSRGEGCEWLPWFPFE